MNRKFTGFFTIAAALVSLSAFAQTNSAAPASAPGASASVAPPTKVGIIRMQDAILATNEGKRDFQTLEAKYQPKQAELQKAGQQLDTDKKTLAAQQDKMNDEAKATLQKQIEKEQRDLQTQLEAAQQDFQGEQNDIYNRIGQKFMQTLDKYAKDGGFAVILDVSNPQSGVLWANLANVDVTEQVVNLYNASSGVAAPPARTGAAPASPRPTAAALVRFSTLE
jgi:Skp family chaperone for outer membrane proteins